MNVVVPAAGEGTRLRPLSADQPKPLVEVAGRPLVTFVLDRAIELDADAGILVTGYRGEQLETHLGESYRGLPLEYVTQPEPIGLADAVYRAHELIEERFLVLNGDNVFLDPLPREVTECPRDGTLLVERGSEDEVATGGAVYTRGNRVVDIEEKPAHPDTDLMTTGCYVLPAATMEACTQIEPSARGELELADAINRLIDCGFCFEAIEYEGWRRNVNTVEDIEAVETKLENRR